MSASFKQINFIKNLFTQAQDLTEQSGSHDLAESALAPIQDILVSALSNPDNVSGPQARQAIDTLLAFNRKVTGLAAAKTLPGLATAERIIPNKFTKDCATCGQTVDAKAGHAALIMGRWDTYCVPCAKGETRDIASEVAASAETFAATGVLTEVPTNEALAARYTPKLVLPPTERHISECPSREQQKRDRGEWTLCGQFIDYDDPHAWEQPPAGSPWCPTCQERDA